MRVLPVKEIRCTSGCLTIASPAREPTPNTMFTTPGGKPVKIMIHNDINSHHTEYKIVHDKVLVGIDYTAADIAIFLNENACIGYF